MLAPLRGPKKVITSSIEITIIAETKVAAKTLCLLIESGLLKFLRKGSTVTNEQREPSISNVVIMKFLLIPEDNTGNT